MEVTNGEISVDLPESLAKLLISGKNDWREGISDAEEAAPVDEGDEHIPMTHIPGVVPDVSMEKVRKLVASGDVPFVKEGRTKLVRPSDVRNAIAVQ
jgi:hypothetical protein